MEEIWKDIENFSGIYQVSNLGNVKSLDREWKQRHYSGNESHYFKCGKILKPQLDGKGCYFMICLHKDKTILTVKSLA